MISFAGKAPTVTFDKEAYAKGADGTGFAEGLSAGFSSQAAKESQAKINNFQKVASEYFDQVEAATGERPFGQLAENTMSYFLATRDAFKYKEKVVTKIGDNRYAYITQNPESEVEATRPSYYEKQLQDFYDRHPDANFPKKTLADLHREWADLEAKNYLENELQRKENNPSGKFFSAEGMGQFLGGMGGTFTDPRNVMAALLPVGVGKTVAGSLLKGAGIALAAEIPIQVEKVSRRVEVSEEEAAKEAFIDALMVGATGGLVAGLGRIGKNVFESTKLGQIRQLTKELNSLDIHPERWNEYLSTGNLKAISADIDKIPAVTPEHTLIKAAAKADLDMMESLGVRSTSDLQAVTKEVERISKALDDGAVPNRSLGAALDQHFTPREELNKTLSESLHGIEPQRGLVGDGVETGKVTGAIDAFHLTKEGQPAYYKSEAQALGAIKRASQNPDDVVVVRDLNRLNAGEPNTYTVLRKMDQVSPVNSHLFEAKDAAIIAAKELSSETGIPAQAVKVADGYMVVEVPEGGLHKSTIDNLRHTPSYYLNGKSAPAPDPLPHQEGSISQTFTQTAEQRSANFDYNAKLRNQNTMNTSNLDRLVEDGILSNADGLKNLKRIADAITTCSR